MQPHRGHWLGYAGIVLITACAFFARWQGAEGGLPHLRNADEQIYLEQYLGYASGEEHPDHRPRFSTYPALWARGTSQIPRGPPSTGVDELETERRRAAHDVLFLRRCVALLASLAIPATWLLALRFVSTGWALGAAALVAASVLHTGFSIQARPHGILTTAVLLALLGAVEHARRGTWRSALLAGLGSGAALAVLQNGAATLLPLAVAVALRGRGGIRLALQHGAVAFVAVVALFLAAYPGVWWHAGQLDNATPGHSTFLANLGLSLGQFSGGGQRALWSAFFDHDPPLLAGAIVGAVVLCTGVLRGGRPWPQSSAASLVVLAFALPYAVVLVLFQSTFVRFALPLVPVLAVLAVTGLARLRRVGVAVLVVLVTGQTLVGLRYLTLLVRPDTAELAADWLRRSVDRERESIAVSPLVELPLVRTTEALRARTLAPAANREKWLQHQVSMSAASRDRIGHDLVDLPLREAEQREALRADPSAWVASIEADYVVLDVHTEDVRALLQDVRRAVRARGTLVASFLPQGVGSAHPHSLDAYLCPGYVGDEHFVWRLPTAGALGPWIEIYRIEREH